MALAAREFRILDMGVNRTGFVGAKVICAKKTRLWFLFDEILSNNDVDFKRLGCVNIISYELEPGTYQLESIEPYTLPLPEGVVPGRALRGRGRVSPRVCPPPSPGARSPPATSGSTGSSPRAWKRSGRTRSDIFMDCPSRERAGWLCDSYFTARVAADLDGERPSGAELLREFPPARRSSSSCPTACCPCVTPPTTTTACTSPIGRCGSWCSWRNTAPAAATGPPWTALRPKVLKLFDFFKRYENQDGLLEKLPSWVFVEWSDADQFVQDVNYPSNMLYAGALAAAGRTYDMPELAAKAERIRADRSAGNRSTGSSSSTTRSAAKTANSKSPATAPRSANTTHSSSRWPRRKAIPNCGRLLRDKFGPNREGNQGVSRSSSGQLVHRQHAADGTALPSGRSQQILDESIAYLLYMADRTGTLWENTEPTASCNHGFASHIVHTLYRDVLGVRHIDPIAHKVAIQFGDVSLDYCEGTMPTPDGAVQLHWRKKGGHDRVPVERAGRVSGDDHELKRQEAVGKMTLDRAWPATKCWRTALIHKRRNLRKLAGFSHSSTRNLTITTRLRRYNRSSRRPAGPSELANSGLLATTGESL